MPFGVMYLKRIATLIFVLTLFICSSLTYAERIYISRLSDTDYFINQYDTGIYSSTNCGPTSLGMIFKYINYKYTSVSQLRYCIRPYDGWVYTDEIEEYLLENNISYEIEQIQSEENIIQILCNGGIVMVCLNVMYISYNTSTLIGRSFIGGTGHYIVISGFYKDDTKCYFEVLDPSNKQVKYYKSEEVIKAITLWWPYSINFYKKDFVCMH